MSNTKEDKSFRRRRRRTNGLSSYFGVCWAILGMYVPVESSTVSPLQEELLRDVECIPGGSLCDLSEIKGHFTSYSSLSYSSETSGPVVSDSSHSDEFLLIQFVAFNNTFTLEVFPDILSLREGEQNESCFYSGRVLDEHEEESSVSLNLCTGGLTGNIHTKKEEYYVIPTPDRDEYHRVYKLRRDLEDSLPFSSKDFADTSRRTRRSSSGAFSRKWPPPSKNNSVEVLVVADGPMVKYHRGKVEEYILTIMRIVSTIYRDSSLGNLVEMSVVKLITLKESDSFVTKHSHKQISASQMLKTFCAWQATLRLNHDVALLLTRENICRHPQTASQNCDTLGLAELGTMCDPDNSCAIVQDNGLSAAFTIAHELGHVLNMPHDDDQKCQSYYNSKDGKGAASHVMSRMLDHNTNPWKWSTCSRHYITRFLDANYGHCLLNAPATNYLNSHLHKRTKLLPGQHFDEDKQCEFVFGHGSKICPYMPPCSRLWCTTPPNNGSTSEENGCRTQHMPWADGTPCGRNRWCMRSKCVDVSSTWNDSPVDGSWSPWLPWSECSRSCGGGIRKSVRKCNNPEPEFGGRYCIGDRVRYESCNTKECESWEESVDFRTKQCKDYDNNNFEIDGVPKNVKWVPKYSGIKGTDRCKLYCRVEDSSAYYLLATSVTEGTPCGPDTFHMCVSGQCIPAGCDHILGSDLSLDWCGICGGNNETCVKETGLYERSSYGYNTVVTIPAGSTNIQISQESHWGHRKDDSYIALRQPFNEDYLLNGEYVMSMFRKTIQYGGITLEYSGSNAPLETITSSNLPLKRDMSVEILMVGDLHPPKVKYSYVISKPKMNMNGEKLPIYKWEYSPRWSHCDKFCQGKQRSPSVCLKSQPDGYPLVEVNETNCYHLPRPKDRTKDCNQHCRFQWAVKSKGMCSAKCGETGYRQLEFECVQVSAGGKTIHDQENRFCEGSLKNPKKRAQCSGVCEGVKWKYSSWTQCSATCNGGLQTRNATCVDKHLTSIDESHCSKIQLVDKQGCNLESCPEWKFGEWRACNVSCGEGIRQRPYWCEVHSKKADDPSECAHLKIPKSIEPCHMKPCDDKLLNNYAWFSEGWSNCSASCGKGVRTRKVYCIRRGNPNAGKISNTFCSSLTRKPKSKILCMESYCKNDVRLNSIYPSKGAKSLAPHKKLRKKIEKGYGRYQWKGRPPLRNDKQFSGHRRYVPKKTGRRKSHCFDRESNTFVSWNFCSKGRQKKFRNSQDAKWVVGEWSDCSVTCGKGNRTRSVSCVSRVTGKPVKENFCKIIPSYPSKEEECEAKIGCDHQVPQMYDVEHRANHPIIRFYWIKGNWSRCSQTCGGGFKNRIVVCQDYTGNPSSLCDETKKPPEIVSCNSEPCPKWNFGGWAKCDKPCGGGFQHRLVRCQDHLGQALQDLDCDVKDKPVHWRKCNSKTCENVKPKYLWRKSKWEDCSKTCGTGITRRKVRCVDMNSGGKNVEDYFCSRSHGRRRSNKPRIVKKCNRIPCPYEWIPGEWSDCSHTCGKGIQHRQVECHRVNPFHWYDPEPVSRHSCDAKNIPKSFQTCSISECHHKYLWKVGPWGDCTWKNKPCGKKGKRKRKLFCTDRNGVKVRKKLCRRYLKSRPKLTQKCGRKICGYKSCLDMRQKTSITRNGEYPVLFAGKNVSIYCHDMDSSVPKEYISLLSGEEENYSEIYGLRLQRPDSCPYNGTRNDDCDCFRDSTQREGRTNFQKIRVNVTSLKVNTHDFTFTKQIQGELVPFGEAGDCYSTSNCPQGRFSINLLGTGVRISPYMGWVGQGNRPSLWLKRESDNQIIFGKCGGYCGTCTPEPHIGLKLDILPSP